ncbi:MAG TPA: hypothetical protein VMJ13_02245 [Candidatus Acidoferrum sp.]|nr:hypothetical protein [Candidatus Acidoferrum sp.]
MSRIWRAVRWTVPVTSALAIGCATGGGVWARGDGRATPPYAVGEAVPTPRVFAEGVVSTVDDEAGVTFSPDGTEMYFTKLVPYTTFPRYGVICVSRYSNGKWGTPEIVPFSGKYLDWGAKISPDGKTMLFTSSRPAPGRDEHVLRIWSVERTEEGWGEPQVLQEPINAPADRWNMDASVTSDGTIYFASDREEPFHFQIYRVRHEGGKYAAAEKLGPAINSKFNDAQPYISPDEKILIFSSTGDQSFPYAARAGDMQGGGRPYPRADLYVSVKKNGEWTPARHLEHGINTVAEEGYATLTPDGHYMFFTSERNVFDVPLRERLSYEEMEHGLDSIFNGHGNVFFIDAGQLDIAGAAAVKP